MSARSVRIESMFGWVMESIKLVKKNFRSFVSASLVTIVIAILVCLPMWFVMMGNMMATMKSQGMSGNAMPMAGMPMAGGDMTMFFIVYAITIVVSLLMFPPILIGWFKLCQNADKGIATSGFDILKPYKDMPLWLRGLGFSLLGFLVYLLVFGLFALAFSGPIMDFMHQMEAQQMAILSGAEPAPPSFPFALFIAYFGFIGVAMFLQLVYMVGFTEISLRSTSAIDAMKIAAASVFKNGLKLILFLVCVIFIFYIAFFIVGMILGVIAVLLSFIHPALGMVAMFLLFMPLMLILYPLMFSGHYFMWKGMLGDDTTTAPEIPPSSLPV